LANRILPVTPLFQYRTHRIGGRKPLILKIAEKEKNMTIPYHQDPEHIAPANQAPRCQHLHATGRRCGSPALRGEKFCYFHERLHSTTNWTDNIDFIEDAHSLQCAIMKVIDLMRGGHSPYQEIALLLRSLRLACMNLKAFAAERAEREAVGSGKAPAEGKDEKREPERAESLTGRLPGTQDQGQSAVI